MQKKRNLGDSSFPSLLFTLKNIKIYAYANKILDYQTACPMSLINFSEYNINRVKSNKHYTEEERLRLLDYLATIPDEKKDAYDLAIELDFELGLRIAELKAIKHCDISKGFVYIHGQVLEKKVNGHVVHTYEDYVKTQNEEGLRYLPLSDRAKKIIARLNTLLFGEEYLFKKDGRYLTTCTFNRHLQKHCPKAGIPYKSSHKIRFGFATRLISKKCPLNELSAILGHTNIATTSRYVKVVQKATQNARMLDYMGA